MTQEKDKKGADLLAGRNSSPTLLGAAVAEDGLPIIHHNVALIEFANPKLLDEVLRVTALKDYVVRRLSDTVVIIDHARQEDLIKLLTKRGYEPKILVG